MKRIAWLVVLTVAGLAALAVAGARVRQGRVDGPASAAVGGTVVRMTAEGFAPPRLSVTTGTEVTFVNAGPDDRWPASNIHPTHAIYSAFDPRRPIPPGGSWAFVFDRAGIWRYHDHLAPSLTGVVTVE